MSREYTVGEVSELIENIISNSNIKNILITGELSNITYQKSGHLYFSLKDGSSIIKCAIFSYQYKGIDFVLKEGNKVRIRADINYYKPSGTINFIVSSIEKLDNLGLLYEKLEKLKKEYAEKGYFLNEIKKPKPKIIKRLGVVTSGTGAAIEDIVKTTHNRDKYVDIYLYPVKVQGDGASMEISNAIKYFNDNNYKYNLDALIVGRGGGSIEDLWAFNEKEVIEAIYNSEIFVVSAVGHETDVLLSDFVADLRASTPTQAAEQLIQDYNKEMEFLKNVQYKLETLMYSKYKNILINFDNIKNSYIINNFENRIINYRIGLNELENSVNKEFENRITKTINNFENIKNKFNISNFKTRFDNSRFILHSLKEKLESNLYKILNNSKFKLETIKLKVSKHSNDEILKKGYSITTLNGKIIKDVSKVKQNDLIKTHLSDGIIESIVK